MGKGQLQCRGAIVVGRGSCSGKGAGAEGKGKLSWVGVVVLGGGSCAGRG